uniref:Putative secreted protein n=1 Tax=Amblyomma cajennense TaxID=34607 RepID=A0A023FBP0_AMBCJ
MATLFMLASLFVCSLCAQFWHVERGEEWLYIDDRKSWRTGSSELLQAALGIRNLKAQQTAVHAKDRINARPASMLREYEYIDSGKTCEIFGFNSTSCYDKECHLT